MRLEYAASRHTSARAHHHPPPPPSLPTSIIRLCQDSLYLRCARALCAHLKRSPVLVLLYVDVHVDRHVAALSRCRYKSLCARHSPAHSDSGACIMPANEFNTRHARRHARQVPTGTHANTVIDINKIIPRTQAERFVGCGMPDWSDRECDYYGMVLIVSSVCSYCCW